MNIEDSGRRHLVVKMWDLLFANSSSRWFLPTLSVGMPAPIQDPTDLWDIWPEWWPRSWQWRWRQQIQPTPVYDSVASCHMRKGPAVLSFCYYSCIGGWVGGVWRTLDRWAVRAISRTVPPCTPLPHCQSNQPSGICFFLLNLSHLNFLFHPHWISSLLVESGKVLLTFLAHMDGYRLWQSVRN